mmetsp:Transcript_15745/g.23375  ORF Transcript_15745/g.23375 Transcript_15745/m.23375 type:complete len:116 (+) Transcript_15745:259-606(+)
MLQEQEQPHYPKIHSYKGTKLIKKMPTYKINLWMLVFHPKRSRSCVLITQMKETLSLRLLIFLKTITQYIPFPISLRYPLMIAIATNKNQFQSITPNITGITLEKHSLIVATTFT